MKFCRSREIAVDEQNEEVQLRIVSGHGIVTCCISRVALETMIMSMIALIRPPMIGIVTPTEVAENGFPDGFMSRPFAAALQRSISSPPAVLVVLGRNHLQG